VSDISDQHANPQASNWLRDCQNIADGIRRRALSHTVVHGGYLSQACSSAEVFGLLYGHEMNLGPSLGPAVPPRYEGWTEDKSDRVPGMVYNGGRAPDTDRFFLSPTHYALVLYCALIEAGRLDESALEQFNTDGSRLEMIGGERSPGIEVNGGSFGQAISQAAGVAWARRKQGDTGRVFVFLGDGELQEGQSWEAIMSMGVLKLDNMTVVVDVNRQQCDGLTEDVVSLEPLDEKFIAFGWNAYKVDGHDVQALSDAIAQPRNSNPTVVLAYTSAYRGIPLLEKRFPNLHYVRFKSEEERAQYKAAADAMQLSGAV